MSAEGSHMQGLEFGQFAHVNDVRPLLFGVANDCGLVHLHLVNYPTNTSTLSPTCPAATERLLNSILTHYLVTKIHSDGVYQHIKVS